jgi:hypothetical protein
MNEAGVSSYSSMRSSSWLENDRQYEQGQLHDNHKQTNIHTDFYEADASRCELLSEERSALSWPPSTSTSSGSHASLHTQGQGCTSHSLIVSATGSQPPAAEHEAVNYSHRDANVQNPNLVAGAHFMALH